MSVPTTQQAKLVPFTLSTDNVTYRNVVCMKVWNFNLDNPVQEEETQCGVHVGLGSSRFSFDFEAVHNSTINGGTEVSAAEVLDYAIDQTEVYAKVQPTGIYVQGSGYITNFKLTGQVGNLVSFTATFTGTGTPDNVA